MFKVGDFVALNQPPYTYFVVTRIYDNDFMAIGTFDVLDGMIFEEYKVKQKYFKSLDLDRFIVPGMSYRQMKKNFVDSGYFSVNKDGSLSLNYTENSLRGFSPSWGLDLDFFPITAVE